MAIQAVRAVQASRIIQAIPGIRGFSDAKAPSRSLDGLAALKSFERGWELLERSGSPTQHFVWASALVESYGGAELLRVLTVGPKSQPSALAPLIRDSGWHGRLETLGVRQLYEPTDFLYTDPSGAKALAEALAQEAVPVWLPRVPSDSPLLPAMQAAYRGRGTVCIRRTEGCPYIELDARWSEPERQFNAGRQSDFRRALRHAERLGKVSFEVRIPAAEELPKLLDEAWAVEAAGWKRLNGSALACKARLGEFFRRYALFASRKGILRLCFMRIDGRAVAMQFATECADRLWLLKIGYDEAFERCSPGNLLMLHTVAYAARRGLRFYEFLGCTAPWTYVWTRSVRECVAVRAYPLTARGLAILGLDAAGSAWRRLRRLW